jgi:hypothetical protein
MLAIRARMIAPQAHQAAMPRNKAVWMLEEIPTLHSPHRAPMHKAPTIKQIKAAVIKVRLLAIMMRASLRLPGLRVKIHPTRWTSPN